jgi:hypothetical protein
MATENMPRLWRCGQGLSRYKPTPSAPGTPLQYPLVSSLPAKIEYRRLDLGGTMITVTMKAEMEIKGKSRQLEMRDDKLWYLSTPEDQIELGVEGKSYMDWYREYEKEHPRLKSTMVYS